MPRFRRRFAIAQAERAGDWVVGFKYDDTKTKAVQLISAMLAKVGITSAHDALGSPDDLRAYQDAHDSGDLLTRVFCMIGSDHIDRMLAAGVRTGLGDEWVRVGAMKAMCDGSISESVLLEMPMSVPA